MSIGDAVLGMLESLSDDGSSRPSGAPTLRVYVPEASDVPPGFVAHRDGGEHYYVVTERDLEHDPEPRRTSRVEEVDPKSWSRYRGPMGGEGWKNINTGNVVYQDTHPAVEQSGVSPDTEREARSRVADMESEEVARVVAAELGEDPDSVSDEVMQQYGNTDPWQIAQEGVAAAAREDEMSRTGSDMVESMMHALAGTAEPGTEEGGAAVAAKSWVPYSGPQGGTGWENTDTGQVIYGELPTGDMVDPEELTPDEMGEALAAMVGEEEAVRMFQEADGREEIDEAFRDAMDDFTGGAERVEVDDPPPEISQYDVEWGEVETSSYIYDATEEAEYTILSDGQMEAFEDQLRAEHGSDAVNTIDSWRDNWKTTSYSDIAQARERAFMEAADVDGEPRNHSLQYDGDIPRGAVEAARDIASASEHFMEQHYADEDGMVEVHRGLGGRAGNELKASVFADLAEGSSPDSYEFDFNPMTNYSVSRSTAASWGRNTATVTEDRHHTETMAATDLIMQDSQEGEVSMEGGQTEVPADGIAIEDEWSPADLDPGDPDPDAVSAALDTADLMVDSVEHKRDWPDETLAGIMELTDMAKEGRPDDSEEREAAMSAAADAMDEADNPSKLIHNSVEEATGDNPFDRNNLASGVYGGGDGNERNAEVFVNNLTEMEPEVASEVLAEMTGEDFDLEAGGETWWKADDVYERAALWNSEDRKAETPDALEEDDIIQADDDPDSVDWIARSREDREAGEASKSWVPYQGPAGGEGWQNTENGNVVYSDDPPGEPIGRGELLDIIDEADLGPEDKIDMMDRLDEVLGTPDTPDPADPRGASVSDAGSDDTPWTGEENEGMVSPPPEAFYEAAMDNPDVDPGVKENLNRLISEPQADEYDWEQMMMDDLGFEAASVIKSAKRDARFRDNSAPDHLDPSQADEVVDLAETSADSGITANAMDIAVMPNGDNVYVTHVSPKFDGQTFGREAAGPQDAEMATAGAEALEAMGFPAPDHHYEHNRFYAVEEVDGPTVRESPGENTPPVDSRQAYEAMAAQVLIGNRDPHPGNVAMVEGDRDGGGWAGGAEPPESELVAFDLDLAGHNAGNWDKDSGAMKKAADTLGAAGVDDHESRSGRIDSLERETAELAKHLHENRDEILDAIPSESLRDTVEDNIDAWREREGW